MKNVIGLLILATLILILTACNTEKSTGDGDTITLKVAGQNGEDHPNTVALEKMAKTVSEQTDGRIEMKIFPANQLGDYMLMYEEIGKGTVDMGLISAPTHLDSRLQMAVLPYLFTNYDQVQKYYNTESFFGQTIQEIHNGQNIQLLGFHAEGFGGIATTKEINEPLSFEVSKDVLMRVPSIEITTKNTKDLGFNTVSISYADLYTAMQSGTVEGWVGGHPVVNYLQYRDIITHYYQYNNLFEATHLLVNKDVFETLDKADQEIIQEAADDLTSYSFEVSEQLEIEHRQKMADEGIEVIEFSDEELNKLAEYSRENSWSVAEEDIGKDLLNQLLEEIK